MNKKQYNDAEHKTLENHIMENNKEVYVTLLQSLQNIYDDIDVLNLDTEQLLVLRNSHNPKQEGQTVSYRFEADEFCNYSIMQEDRAVAEKILDMEELRHFYDSGEESNSVELRVCANGDNYEWVELNIQALPYAQNKEKKLLITVRNIDKSKLMRGIIDRFIYDSCDYFIYLDAKNDSYVMFSGNDNGTPLPPYTCNSYSTELIKYAHDYVVEEDQQYTIEQMELSHVITQLDKYGEHTFYVGINEENGYRRKCLRYLYYDRGNKMILLVRTDVTDVYLEEKRKNDKLLKALKEAKTDFLTGLDNRMAIEHSIGMLLQNPTITSGAFFFMDIDNFKYINDEYGHDEGDHVLITMANKLKQALENDCIVGRLGGDEFVAFYPNFKSIEDVKRLGEYISHIFDTNEVESKYKTLSCSVGISFYPHDGVRYQDLSKKADTALYTSKNNGRKQYQIYKEV